MWIFTGLLRILVVAFGLLALALTVLFFLVVGLFMVLLGKKPRVIRMSRMSTNWGEMPTDEFRAPPKDVTPKAYPALDQ